MNAMLQLVPSVITEHHLRRMYERAERARDAEREKDWNRFCENWAEVALPPGTAEASSEDVRKAVDGAAVAYLALQACALYVFPFADDIEQTKNARALADKVFRSAIYGLERLEPFAGEAEPSMELTPKKTKHVRISRFLVRAEEERVFRTHRDALVLAGQPQPLSIKSVDPLVQRFRFLKVLGSGSYGIAFLVETATSTWPTMRKRKCVIKAELTEQETEARIMYEITKAFSPERLKSYPVNFVRLYTWSRSLSDILELKNAPRSLPEHYADTRLAEFLERREKLGGALRWIYTAMEYADMGSLSSLARSSPETFFRDSRCFRGVMVQIAATLSALAHVGFRHGDLHAPNVLFSRADPDDPRLEVLDYRLAFRRVQVRTKRCGGRIVKLSDFGFSTIRQKGFELGSRQEAGRAWDLNLLALSMLDILLSVCGSRALRRSDVTASVWTVLRRCIVTRFEAEDARSNAEWIQRYLGSGAEQLDSSDPDYAPDISDQRGAYYASLTRRVNLARRYGRMPEGTGEGFGASADELLELLSSSSDDEPIVEDPRRSTTMNVLDPLYSPFLPLKQRFV